MALTEQGAHYVLTDPAGYGMGLGTIAPGTPVVVDEVPEETTAGAAGDVVLSFSIGTADVGGVVVDLIRRAAIPAEDFEQLFTKAEDK